MKKLSDSAIFSKLIGSQELITKMKLIASENGIEILSQAALPNEFNSIDRRINYSTKGAIMNRLDKNQIRMFDDEKLKLPTYINTVPGKGVNGTVSVYINLNRYKTRSGEIYPKTLFAALQNALILEECLSNWTRFTNNMELMKLSCLIYSRIVTKVLDKVFALDLDTFNSDFMSYIFAMFFLKNMADRNNDELNEQLAYKCCFNKSSLELIKNYEQELADTKYDSIFDLIESLKVVSAVKTINVRTFTENFVRMYGESCLLALDYMPMFFQMIFSTAIGGNLCKDYMVESVAGSNIQKAYIAFSKLID